MTHIDPPSRPGGPPYPSDRDVRSGRHRARHTDAAPDAYNPEEQYGYEYGDGISTHPMYGRPAAQDEARGRPARNGSPQPTSGAQARPTSGAPARPTSGGPARPTPGSPTRPTTGGPARPTSGAPGRPTSGAPGRPTSGAPGRPTSGAPQPQSGPGTSAPGVETPTSLNLDLTAGRTNRSRESRRADAEKAAEGRKNRAGRNLPAAIGVGVLLAAIVLGSLFLWRPAFVAVLAVGAAVGVWEMCHALAGAGRAHPPLVPLIGGCLVMPALAWYGGAESLVLGLLLTVLAATVWRLSGPAAGFQRDMTAATLIAVYVPFLISFGVLLAVPDDGDLRVLAVLACVVFSDTGGYVAGVLFGKHPMAPKASPKKSWEGLAGSLIATAITGALFVHYLLHQPWWHGAIVGVGVSAAAVLGDLSESILKRDLGVKDMSNLLPGHGGLMDRLDSVVFAAPTAFMLLTLLAPVGS